jgi:hypothetical protein
MDRWTSQIGCTVVVSLCLTGGQAKSAVHTCTTVQHTVVSLTGGCGQQAKSAEFGRWGKPNRLYGREFKGLARTSEWYNLGIGLARTSEWLYSGTSTVH